MDWANTPVTSTQTVSPTPLSFDGSASFDLGSIQQNTQASTNAPTQPQANTAAPQSSTSSFFSSPLASIGLQYGQKVLGENQGLFSGGLAGYLRGTRLRYYFSLNNSYIVRKVSRLLFPYLPLQWQRSPLVVDPLSGVDSSASAANGPAYTLFQTPKTDVSAPDLYIPTMAFITLILLTSAIVASHSFEFNPEMIGLTASRTLVCLLIEVIAITSAFYLTDIYTSIQLLDMTALCAYKYVNLIIILFSGLLFGSSLFYLLFFVLTLSTGVFMIRSLIGWIHSKSILPSTGSHHTPALPLKFKYILLGILLAQYLFSSILLYPTLSPMSSRDGLLQQLSTPFATSTSQSNNDDLSKSPQLTVHNPLDAEGAARVEVTKVEAPHEPTTSTQADEHDDKKEEAPAAEHTEPPAASEGEGGIAIDRTDQQPEARAADESAEAAAKLEAAPAKPTKPSSKPISKPNKPKPGKPKPKKPMNKP